MTELGRRGRLQLTVAVVILGLFTGCGEQRQERFGSGADALASDTARRGWIPPWLPADATSIEFSYDLDTNYRWLSFRLERPAAATLQQHLREIPEHEIRTLSLLRPRADVGWPEGIIQQQPANDAALNDRCSAAPARSCRRVHI